MTTLESGIQVGQRSICVLDVGMPAPQSVSLVSKNCEVKIIYPVAKQEVQLLNKKKASILIVEDEANIREALSVILQQSGYSVDTAGNGQEAIQKSKVKFFNLALLDIKLPDMEGTKLLINLHESLPKMVKIMVTGYPTIENAVESLNLGADAYFIKTFKPEELLSLIKSKLEKQSQAQELMDEKVDKWVETKVRKLKTTNPK
jgi:DNA-binding NtrC family response regulator